MKIKYGAASVLVLAGVVLLTGCATKLTYERWRTLTLQSPKTEVETVLGDPDALRKDDHWMYHNSDKQITVNVEFVGGDTITYSRWVDPDHGVHEIGTGAIEGTDLIDRGVQKTDIDQ